MNIYINLKSAGKRRPILEKTPYCLPDESYNLRRLIEAVVMQEVERYNSRGLEEMLLPFLPPEEIEQQCVAGKVGFGRIYSDKKANPSKAVATALSGFEDGLFRVIVNDAEATDLNADLNIKDGSVITFIRLTFLAGRLFAINY
ncbi:MAG: hypothetical protein FWG90_13110 [Oscillospiraceae bacterium]|nr:hypothetical protein [Oscillospiraceae bacterium]